VCVCLCTPQGSSTIELSFFVGLGERLHSLDDSFLSRQRQLLGPCEPRLCVPKARAERGVAAGAVPLCPRGELPARRSQRRTRGGSQLAGPLSPPVEQPARLGAREKRALQDEHAVGGGPLRPQPQQRWEGLGERGRGSGAVNGAEVGALLSADGRRLEERAQQARLGTSDRAVRPGGDERLAPVASGGGCVRYSASSPDPASTERPRSERTKRPRDTAHGSAVKAAAAASRTASVGTVLEMARKWLGTVSEPAAHSASISAAAAAPARGLVLARQAHAATATSSLEATFEATGESTLRRIASMMIRRTGTARCERAAAAAAASPSRAGAISASKLRSVGASCSWRAAVSATAGAAGAAAAAARRAALAAGAAAGRVGCSAPCQSHEST